MAISYNKLILLLLQIVSRPLFLSSFCNHFAFPLCFCHPHFKNSSCSLCLQAAPSPGWTDGSVCGKDSQPVEGGSSNAVVGRVCERGAASSRCQRPSGGGLPKQVRPQRAALLPHFLCSDAQYVSMTPSLCFRRKQRYQSAPRNIHRHVLLSEIKEATSSLPFVRND